jgi:hypothetical protein
LSTRFKFNLCCLTKQVAEASKAAIDYVFADLPQGITLTANPRASSSSSTYHQVELNRRTLAFTKFMKSKGPPNMKYDRFELQNFRFFAYAPPAMDDENIVQTNAVCLQIQTEKYERKLRFMYSNFDKANADHTIEQDWYRFYRLAHYFFVALWVDAGMAALNIKKIIDYVPAVKFFNHLPEDRTREKEREFIKRVQNDVALGYRVSF